MTLIFQRKLPLCTRFSLTKIMKDTYSSFSSFIFLIKWFWGIRNKFQTVTHSRQDPQLTSINMTDLINRVQMLVLCLTHLNKYKYHFISIINNSSELISNSKRVTIDHYCWSPLISLVTIVWKGTFPNWSDTWSLHRESWPLFPDFSRSWRRKHVKHLPHSFFFVKSEVWKVSPHLLPLCLCCPWHGDVRLNRQTVTTVQSDALKMENRGFSPHFIHIRGSLSASWRTLQTCFSRCPSAPGASSRSAWRPSSCPPARGTPWARCGSSRPPTPHRSGSLSWGPAAGPLRLAPCACGAGPACCPRSRWEVCPCWGSPWWTWWRGWGGWPCWNWPCRRCCRPGHSRQPTGASSQRVTSSPRTDPVKSDRKLSPTATDGGGMSPNDLVILLQTNELCSFLTHLE